MSTDDAAVVDELQRSCPRLDTVSASTGSGYDQGVFNTMHASRKQAEMIVYLTDLTVMQYASVVVGACQLNVVLCVNLLRGGANIASVDGAWAPE